MCMWVWLCTCMCTCVRKQVWASVWHQVSSSIFLQINIEDLSYLWNMSMSLCMSLDINAGSHKGQSRCFWSELPDMCAGNSTWIPWKYKCSWLLCHLSQSIQLVFWDGISHGTYSLPSHLDKQAPGMTLLPHSQCWDNRYLALYPGFFKAF